MLSASFLCTRDSSGRKETGHFRQSDALWATAQDLIAFTFWLNASSCCLAVSGFDLFSSVKKTLSDTWFVRVTDWLITRILKTTPVSLKMYFRRQITRCNTFCSFEAIKPDYVWLGPTWTLNFQPKFEQFSFNSHERFLRLLLSLLFSLV